jgi:hypothetical protein
MKQLLLTLLASLALLSSAFAGHNEELWGATSIRSGTFTIQSGVVVTYKAGSTLDFSAATSVPAVVRVYSLGTPILAATNYIVASANMKTTAYTIAHQPDVPRNITVTQTAVGTTDIGVPFVIVGTDYNGGALTESITSVAGSTVVGAKAFKTITSVTSPAWVINAASTSTADTVVVGVGSLIGLPYATAAGTALTTLGTTVANSTVTGTTLPASTVDASGGTYDGAKQLKIYLSR